MHRINAARDKLQDFIASREWGTSDGEELAAIATLLRDSELDRVWTVMESVRRDVGLIWENIRKAGFPTINEMRAILDRIEANNQQPQILRTLYGIEGILEAKKAQSELPASSNIRVESLNFSTRVCNVLVSQGFTTLDKLLSMRFSDLLKYKGMGEYATLKEIREVLLGLDKSLISGSVLLATFRV